MPFNFESLLKKNFYYISFRVLALISIILFLNSNASARFLSAQDSPAFLYSAQASTFYLNSSSGRCTASLISNNGHFLTARHCLQRCLIPQGVFKPSLDKISGVNYYVLDQKTLGAATCEVELSGMSETVTIEATSPGLILKMDEQSLQILEPELFHSLVQKGYTSEGDFVIFKSLSYINSDVCIKLVPETNLKKSLYTFGYPSETFRHDSNNSDGVNQYFSAGFYQEDILNNSCLGNINLNDSQRRSLQQKFNFETSFLSTLDAIYGSSGSAVIDDDSNIQGILTNVYRHTSITRSESDEPENLFCEGSAKALRSSTIINFLKEINFNLKNLDCNSEIKTS